MPVLVSAQPSNTFWFKQYTTADGLAHNVGFEMLQTADGLMWIATDEGISRFNGFEFNNFTEKNGLKNPYVISVDEAKDRSIHLGTYGEGHHILKKDSIFKPNNGSPIRANQIDVFKDGTILIDGGKVGDSKLYIKYPNNNQFSEINFFHPEDTIDSFFGGHHQSKTKFINIKGRAGEKIVMNKNSHLRLQIYAYCVTKNEEIWLTTNQGVYRCTIRTLQKFNKVFLKTVDNKPIELEVRFLPTREMALPNQDFYAVAEGNADDIWFGGEAVMVRLAGEKIQMFTKNLPANNVSRFVVSGSDKIYFATSDDIIAAQKGDLYAYDPGSSNLTHLNSRIGLKSAISYLYIDREDNLWMTTHGSGLYCIFPQYIQNYSIEDGLTNSFIRNIIETPEGDIWASSQSGLNIFSNYQWTAYPWLKTHDFASNGIGLRKNGQIAISISNEIKNKFYSLSKEIAPQKIGPSGLNIFKNEDENFLPEFRLQLHSEGVLTGVKQIKGLPIKDEVLLQLNRRVPDLTAFSNPVRFAFDKDTVWLGTREQGLFKIFGNTLINYTTANGLPSNWVDDLKIDDEGALWVASKNGFFKFGNKTIQNFTKDQGLLSNWCQALYFDHRGTLWIGTPKGLHWFQMRSIPFLKIAKISCG